MNEYFDKMMEVLNEYNFNGVKYDVFTLREIKIVMAEYAMACLHDSVYAREAAEICKNGVVK